MTYGELLTEIETNLGIEQQHYSVEGRIKDIAEYLYIDIGEGRLMSAILTDIMNRLNCSCADALISSELKAILAKCKYEEETGVSLTLLNCTGADVISLTITGNSVQEGTPTPESPIPINNVGELVTQGEHVGKYAIPVTVKNAITSPTQTVTKTLYLDEPLRAGDTLEVVDGKLIQRRGIKVFYGTENVQLWRVNQSQTSFYLVMNSILLNMKTNSRLISSHFGETDYYSIRTEALGIRCGNKNWAFGISLTDLPTQTSSAFNSWLSDKYLAGTPVTVEYELETPIEIDISGQDIPTFEGTTVVEVLTSIQPANMACKYYVRG